MKEKLMIVDSNGLAHRGYHALPDLTTPEGEPVSAVYGFFLVFLKALKELKPDCVAACFDRPEPTFRHEKYEEYKAQRPETPEDLAGQIPLIKEVLAVFGIPVYEKAGFEADDLIATICERIAGDPTLLEAVIVTGDLDLLQLVGEKVKVYGLRRGVKDTVFYDEKKVRERYGFSPALLADYRGLKGDASDNIPGIKGVGPKTATKLLKKFGGLEKIYRNLEEEELEAGPRVKSLLREGFGQALFSRGLARVRRDVDFDFSLEECGWSNYDKEAVEGKFKELGFETLISRLPGNRREQAGLF